MIDKKLKYKNIKGQKHMLAYITPSERNTLVSLGGQETMTSEGIPAYPPSENYGGDHGSGKSSNTGGDGSGRPNMADIAGPVTGPPDMSHFGDTGDIVQADFTPYNERPDTITDFMDNYKAQFKSMGLKNAIPGAQIYNIGKTASQTKKARELLGLAPAEGPGPTEGGGGDGQGIMNLYNPNMLNISGEVEEEVPVSQEEEDFKQRYRVANEFRQDKQGQLDPAILEMISKLYT